MGRNFVLNLLILFLLFSTLPVSGEKSVERNAIPEQIKSRQLDKEAEILADYLATHNSPLKYHAQDFVDAAKVYGLDWKLLPAISGVESTFGKFIPGGYNAWGWGVYGNQAVYFKSFKDGIFQVSQGLKESYIDRGLENPYAMNRIYAASPYWGGKVTYFMNDLEKFAQKYEQAQFVANVNEYPAKIAAISGRLSFR